MLSMHAKKHIGPPLFFPGAGLSDRLGFQRSGLVNAVPLHEYFLLEISYLYEGSVKEYPDSWTDLAVKAGLWSYMNVTFFIFFVTTVTLSRFAPCFVKLVLLGLEVQFLPDTIPKLLTRNSLHEKSLISDWLVTRKNRSLHIHNSILDRRP